MPGVDELKMAVEMATHKLKEVTGADAVVEKLVMVAGEAGPVVTGTAVLAGAVVGTYVIHKAVVTTALAAATAAGAYYTVFHVMGPGASAKTPQKVGAKPKAKL